MNKNIISSLLGKRFTVSGNIGNQVEVLCGAKLSTSPTADLGYWEVKSRKNDSLSPITLGGKATDNIRLVIEQVYAKIQNVIVVHYELVDCSFEVTGITLLWELDKSLFVNGLGKFYNKENHKGMIVLRTSERNFIRMYKNKVIRYE
jgi:hypothetical protein